jgi:hypothetical protein
VVGPQQKRCERGSDRDGEGPGQDEGVVTGAGDDPLAVCEVAGVSHRTRPVT